MERRKPPKTIISASRQQRHFASQVHFSYFLTILNFLLLVAPNNVFPKLGATESRRYSTRKKHKQTRLSNIMTRTQVVQTYDMYGFVSQVHFGYILTILNFLLLVAPSYVFP